VPADHAAGQDPGGALPQGAEAPPQGVRTMAIVRWALVGLVAVAAVGSWVHYGAGSRAVRSATPYHCPMHPSVVQDRMGACPICGMDLVLVAAGTRAPAPPSQAGGTAAGAPAAQGRFWCPMHPEVGSDDPEARCEKCGGMKLVPRPDGSAGPRPGTSQGESPPGLVPIDVSAERTQLMGMRTAQVKRERAAGRLRAAGVVSASEGRVTVVTSRFTGWIEELKVAQNGQRVTKGQVLATAYGPELVTAQQVFLNAARWNAGAAASPGAPGPITDARRRLELLGIDPRDIDDLAARGQPASSLPIRSPASGYVAKRSALPGLYVQTGTELFQIADLSTVWVIADLHEHEMGRVQVGQRARLELSAHPGEAFAGRVEFVYPALNPDTRTLQARLEFRNPGLRLRPGMYGEVSIEIPATEGLYVPADAVVDTGDHQYVFLSRPGGRFEPRIVKLGARDEGRVQILAGVSEGDLVVTTANFLVDSESRLRAAIEGFAGEPASREAHEKAEHAGPAHRD